RRVENRLPIRQVYTGNASLAQGLPYGNSFSPLVDQHRNITGFQGREFVVLVETSLTTCCTIQQVHDTACTGFAQMIHIVVLVDALSIGIIHDPEPERRWFVFAIDPSRLRIACVDTDERQWVVVRGAEHECSPWKSIIGLAEYLIHGLDHGRNRAEIRVEGVMSPSGGSASLQIGKDIGIAEGIDGLLRITDQKYTGGHGVAFVDSRVDVLAYAVNLLKDTVLHRVGILKLIDHRHRKLRANDIRQCLTGLIKQRLVQLQ